MKKIVSGILVCFILLSTFVTASVMNVSASGFSQTAAEFVKNFGAGWNFTVPSNTSGVTLLVDDIELLAD